MIELQNLSAGYPGKDVLFDISLTIPEGQITVIVGPNGCGKSTLLKTISGILPLRAGDIRIGDWPAAAARSASDDRTGAAQPAAGNPTNAAAHSAAGSHSSVHSIRDLSPQLLARHISYLAQSRQVPDISVERMVLHGRFPYLSYPRRYRAADFQIAREAMEHMGIADLADAPMSTLSGGTRQKVYLAMALAQSTPIILFDEPTTYLDISHQLQTMEHARLLCREGKTVVMVLHDLSMALQVADQIAVMENGRIKICGRAETVYESGCLDEVFGVHVRRVQTPDGWQYYVTA